MVNWNEQRDKAIRMILVSVKEASDRQIEVDEEKLINEIALMYGFSDKKIKNYIEMLINSKKIKRLDSGYLWAE
jgi:ABC-type microcin C transport system permease subunit YejB